MLGKFILAKKTAVARGMTATRAFSFLKWHTDCDGRNRCRAWVLHALLSGAVAAMSDRPPFHSGWLLVGRRSGAIAGPPFFQVLLGNSVIQRIVSPGVCGYE